MRERDLRWTGVPLREGVRSVAAQYGLGDRVRLAERQEAGTVRVIRFEDGRFQYRIDWDHTPGDDAWYYEGQLAPLDDETRL